MGCERLGIVHGIKRSRFIEDDLWIRRALDIINMSFAIVSDRYQGPIQASI